MEGKKVSVIPIYAFGLIWLAYGLTIGLSSVIHVFICLALSVAVALLTGTVLCKKSPPADTQEEKKKTSRGDSAKSAEPEDALQEKGKAFHDELRELDDKIPDPQISAKLKQISCQLEAIFAVVAKQPEKKQQITQTVEYYLPTMLKLLRQYVYLQEQQSQSEVISAGMTKIAGHLDTVMEALKKQYENLFESDIMDITADIRVMEKKLAADGLAEQKGH